MFSKIHQTFFLFRQMFFEKLLMFFMRLSEAYSVHQILGTETELDIATYSHTFENLKSGKTFYFRVLCVSIIASTVLLKQHSCIDVLLGILLAMVLDTGMTALEHSDARALQRL